MKTLRSFVAAGAVAMLSADAFAAPKTVTLQVSGMACPVCPITVKKALQRVDGVLQADVSLERKEAVVTYDDAKTNVEALIKATGDAGFSSAIKGN